MCAKIKFTKNDFRVNPFQVWLIKTWNYIKDNQNIVYTVIAIIIVLLGALTFYSHYSNKKLEERSLLYYYMINAYNNNSLNQSLQFVTKLNNSYKNSAEAKHALFYKGLILVRKGEYQSAINTFYLYLKYIEEDDANLKSKVLNNIGIAYMNAGQTEEAIETFRKIQNEYMEAPAYKSSIYYEGLCYEMNSDFDKALQQFKMLQSKFPESGWAQAAKYIIDELNKKKS